MDIRLVSAPQTQSVCTLTESSAASSSSNLDSIASAEPFFAALPTPAVQSKPSSISSTLLNSASSAEALSASTVRPAAPGRIPVRDVNSTSRENAVLTGAGWKDFLRCGRRSVGVVSVSSAGIDGDGRVVVMIGASWDEGG